MISSPISHGWAKASFRLGLVFGALFAVVTPPFQAPDEPAHFDRAYEVSEMHLLARRRGGVVGDMLPTSVDLVGKALLSGLPFHPERKQHIGAIRAALHLPLRPGQRQFVNFANTAVYGFVPYLPQAAAIALGRAVAPFPLVLFYLGRFANLAVAVLLMSLSLRTVSPYFRPILFLLVLTPMAVFQMASLSADAVTNGVASLLIAWILRCAFGKEEKLADRDLALVAILSVLLAASKPGYFLISGLALLIPVRKMGTRRKWFRFLCLLALASAGAAGAWAVAVGGLHAPHDPSMGVSPSEHWFLLQAHPLNFVGNVLGYYFRFSPVFAHQFVGKLGWVDTRLPPAAVVLHGLLLVFVALTCGVPESRMEPKHRVLLIVILCSTVLLISVLLYVYTTPIDSGPYFLHGVQGRHFIPLGPLFFLLLCNSRWRIDWERYRFWLVAWGSLLLAIAVEAVVFRYYVQALTGKE